MKTLLPLRQTLLPLLVLLLTIGSTSAQSITNGTPTVTTSDGVRLYVRVAGQGRPCVFVHGGPGAGAAVQEAIAGPMLEQRFQMIYLDQRAAAARPARPLGPTGCPGWYRIWRSCASNCTLRSGC